MLAEKTSQYTIRENPPRPRILSTFYDPIDPEPLLVRAKGVYSALPTRPVPSVLARLFLLRYNDPLNAAAAGAIEPAFLHSNNWA